MKNKIKIALGLYVAIGIASVLAGKKVDSGTNFSVVNVLGWPYSVFIYKKPI